MRSVELFPAKEQLGKTKTITFARPNAKPFEFWIKYADPSQLALPSEKDGLISHYRIKHIPKEAGPDGVVGEADVKVKIRLDAIGTVTVLGAELVEKKEIIVEVPVEEKKAEEKKGDDQKTDEKSGKSLTPLTFFLLSPAFSLSHSHSHSHLLVFLTY